MVVHRRMRKPKLPSEVGGVKAKLPVQDLQDPKRLRRQEARVSHAHDREVDRSRVCLLLGDVHNRYSQEKTGHRSGDRHGFRAARDIEKDAAVPHALQVAQESPQDSDVVKRVLKNPGGEGKIEVAKCTFDCADGPTDLRFLGLCGQKSTPSAYEALKLCHDPLLAVFGLPLFRI